MIPERSYGFFRPIIPVCVALILTFLSFSRTSNANEDRKTAGIDARADYRTVKIGVLAKRGVEKCQEKWGPTAVYLTEAIPGYSFEINPLGFDEINATVEKGEVDFILANSSIYVEMEYLYGAGRIATLNNLRMGAGYTVFGGVIFCRADRKDLRNLKDLKGKTFMAVEETSLGGWHAAWRELKKHGIDPHEDFAGLNYGGTHDAVVYAVRDGKVDAGSIQTDQLERLAKEEKIRIEDFFVFSHDHTGGYAYIFPFIHSTDVYPEWPLAKVRHTSEELAKEVSVALLEMSSDDSAAIAANCAGWTIPLNYQPVHDCLKELRIGPYKDYGKITFQAALRQYWFQLACGFSVICLVVLFAFRVMRLNRRLGETLTITQDEIVKRKQAEKERKILTSQLHQADKMASIGQLAAGVAHEINNPIAYIYSNLNTMNKYLLKIAKEIKKITASEEDVGRMDELTADFGDAISESLEGADKVKKIVADLKGFSRADDAKPEPTDLNKGLESTLNVIWNQLKYHCKVEKDFGDLPEVSCFPSQISQVFLNMLVNAGHATKGQSGLIKIRSWSDKTSVYISIKDNGCGIPADGLSKIFEPFYTTKDVGEGTGLGLSLSYDIIKRHNGSIEVKSVVGEGTEFVISLPSKKSVQPIANTMV
jgi:two-component system sensor histidine kinase TtrS